MQAFWHLQWWNKLRRAKEVLKRVVWTLNETNLVDRYKLASIRLRNANKLQIDILRCWKVGYIVL